MLDDLSNDITIQKLRIEQMKRLRKEIRKLEKLEKMRLRKAIIGGGGPVSVGKEQPPLTEVELLVRPA